MAGIVFASAVGPAFLDDVFVNAVEQTFFSSTVARTSDDERVIALFDDGGACVELFRCSVDAAFILIGNIAASMVNGASVRASNE